MDRELVDVREQVVQVTDAAREKIRQMLDQKGKEGTGIRIYVTGGGCAGLQYGMALDDSPREDDEIIADDGARVFVDSLSAQFLTGATIDYVESLQASGFKIENPNAVRSCGCGHSSEPKKRQA